MRSVFFFGTFLMGLRATSASSALDGSAAGSEGDLQRLQASADLNDIQPESSDALEKLQEAQRASQAFAHRNLPGSHIGNGVIPYDGNANEDSYGGDDVSLRRHRKTHKALSQPQSGGVSASSGEHEKEMDNREAEAASAGAQESEAYEQDQNEQDSLGRNFARRNVYVDFNLNQYASSGFSPVTEAARLITALLLETGRSAGTYAKVIRHVPHRAPAAEQASRTVFQNSGAYHSNTQKTVAQEPDIFLGSARGMQTDGLPKMVKIAQRLAEGEEPVLAPKGLARNLRKRKRMPYPLP